LFQEVKKPEQLTDLGQVTLLHAPMDLGPDWADTDTFKEPELFGETAEDLVFDIENFVDFYCDQAHKPEIDLGVLVRCSVS
jgi:hypothetical protein